MDLPVTEDRGLSGFIPALNSRADEAFADFICEARNVLLHGQRGSTAALGKRSLDAAGVTLDPSPQGVAKVREVIRQEPELAVYMRVKRSCQESYKGRIIGSYTLRQSHYLDMIEAAETQGPGSVTYDPNYVYPAYATAEIHIQPGGYTHPLAGLYYDYGTSIFFGGANGGDRLHTALAAAAPLPADGVVKTVLEIGCSVGQLSTALKLRFPEAHVIGTDISSSMVRYAHWRAAERGVDVDFRQMPAEALTLPDASVDLAAAHILFHELPRPVIEKTLAELMRVLRPGGVFVMWDFPSAADGVAGYANIHGLMDMADNGEPYAYAFVECGIEGLIEAAGFELSHQVSTLGMSDARVCRKPAAH